jgi:hypothetical protein
MLDLIRTEMTHIEGLKTVTRVAGEVTEDEPSDEQSILRSCEKLQTVIVLRIDRYFLK